MNWGAGEWVVLVGVGGGCWWKEGGSVGGGGWE